MDERPPVIQEAEIALMLAMHFKIHPDEFRKSSELIMTAREIFFLELKIRHIRQK